MKKVEYSQIVRRKIKDLKIQLTDKFGENVSNSAIKKITSAINGLSIFEEKGTAVSLKYDMESDYRYLYVAHNYIFYRIEKNQIIIVEMFDDREDFIYKLFGINSTTQDTLDYWDE